MRRFPPFPLRPKRKVFIGYHHKDEYYKNLFEQLLRDVFVNKAVKFRGIDSDLTECYIWRLIQEGYISDSSVCVVLLGSKTYSRKHIDWEISAALSTKVGGYSGLLGLILPNRPDYDLTYYIPSTVPPRLHDNVNMVTRTFMIGPKTKTQSKDM
jgi:hypothetical protein